MKRYVVEFANDIIRKAEGVNCPAAIQRADRVVRMCERGYITNFEAVKALTEINIGRILGGFDDD